MSFGARMWRPTDQLIDTRQERHRAQPLRQRVDDVAALAAFVASPEAAYITGASLTVDGGTNA